MSNELVKILLEASLGEVESERKPRRKKTATYACKCGHDLFDHYNGTYDCDRPGCGCTTYREADGRG